jgi:hypothetical protein
MLSQIMRHLTAAGGMADVNSVLQIELRGQGRKIGGVVIHVMAVADLRGTSMAAPVMGDDAIAAIEEEQHLRVPVIRRQRPAMAKDDRLPLSPILVEDLDAVFGSNKWHGKLLSWVLFRFVRHLSFKTVFPESGAHPSACHLSIALP